MNFHVKLAIDLHLRYLYIMKYISFLCLSCLLVIVFLCLIYLFDLVGFFELIEHPKKKEIEIAYFGLLEEYQNQKLGSYLLSRAIKKSFENKIDRVWLHTCSLDHKNALSNYISRGMKIFKTETVII